MSSVSFYLGTFLFSPSTTNPSVANISDSDTHKRARAHKNGYARTHTETYLALKSEDANLDAVLVGLVYIARKRKHDGNQLTDSNK